jgi:hypothetical protein
MYQIKSESGEKFNFGGWRRHIKIQFRKIQKTFSTACKFQIYILKVQLIYGLKCQIYTIKIKSNPKMGYLSKFMVVLKLIACYYLIGFKCKQSNIFLI